MSPIFDAGAHNRCDKSSYNSTVVGVRKVHAELAVFRVAIDSGIPPLEAGQYTTLGLCACEPSIESAGETAEPHGMIRRAYSIGSPILYEGRLARAPDYGFVEFLISLVHPSVVTRPALTPRLFALNAGSRIFVGPEPRGTYTLAPVRPQDNVVLMATGTGEAPHNAMLAELLQRQHGGRIAVVTCARYRKDLAYLDVHQQLERRFPNYRYVALTTREPENIDASHERFLGRKHVQEFFLSGELEAELGWSLDPTHTHVYLCGNPAMIGISRHNVHDEDESVGAVPSGMVAALVERGFELDRPRQLGNVHVEKFW